MAKGEITPFQWQLSGRWVSKIDGCMLPDTFFQTLENLRYNDAGVESVKGMTAVSADFSSTATEYKVENGFHFKKSLPYDEDHIFVQVTKISDGTSAIYKSDNTTDIPALDTFTLFKTLSDMTSTANTKTVYFSEAPDQSMIMCDGYHNHVWSGDEYRAASIMMFDPAGAYNVDLTEILADNLNDTEHRIATTTTDGGVDSYTKLLLHFDNNLTDTIGTHTLTAVKGLAAVSMTASHSGGFSGSVSTVGSGIKVEGSCERNTDISIYNSYIYTFKTYFTGLTDVAGAKYAVLEAENGLHLLKVYVYTDALRIYKESGYTDTAVTMENNRYYDWRIEVTDGDTCDVYLNDTQVANDVACDAGKIWAFATHGVLYNVASGVVAYIYDIAIGNAYISAPTYTTGKISQAVVVSPWQTNAQYQYVYNRVGFTIPDHADFDFSGGVWTFDAWIYPLTLGNSTDLNYQSIYLHRTDDTHYISIYTTADGKLGCMVRSGASTNIVDIYTGVGLIAANRWTHIQICENGDDWYLFVNGTLRNNTTDTSRCANYTDVVRLGLTYWDINDDDDPFRTAAKALTDFKGYMDEVRVSNGVCRNTTTFTPYGSQYSTYTGTYFYIGSTRPLTKVKFYVSTGNASTATLSGKYWDGNSWESVGTITRYKASDGTVNAGVVLGVSETWDFSTTDITLHKPKVIKDNLAYYYYFTIENLDATTIYQITTYPPVQDLVDIWDGEQRSCLSFFIDSADYSVNVYENDYYASLADTYADMSSFATYAYMGFEEPMCGVKIYFGGAYVNATEAILSIDYWDGDSWVTCGNLDDATSVGGVTFAKTGTVSWSPIANGSEYKTSVDGGANFYYYRITASATLDSSVRLDTIRGIPAQKTIPAYRFPVLWQNRLWLLNDQSNEGNKALGSSSGTVCVFNGQDSGELEFGGAKEINCGATLFTRYGANLYDNLIICKNNETYLVNGVAFDGDAPYVVYQVSVNRGCIAPLTMKQCDMGYEISQDTSKHALMWLSDGGVMLFDANTLTLVSRDIDDRFSSNNTYSMLRTLSNKSAAFFDANKGEYHLLIPVGSSATYLNEEDVYDVVRKKWFQIKRGTKYLWCGFKVEDSYGNFYIFGGTGDGYVERLEFGTTFDSLAITNKFRFNDSTLNGAWEYRKELMDIKLVALCMTTTSQTVAVSHYADGKTAASTPAITAIAVNNSGHRFFKFHRDMSFIGVTHSLEFSISTTDEASGFVPLVVTGHYKLIDIDKEEK